MERNIRVESLDEIPVDQQRIELAERKGMGHPDSICDGIAESVMRALSQEYLDRFGAVLHHNTDECQLVAGRSQPDFGGGEVVEPIYVLIVGRATKEFEGEAIPTDTLAVKAARDYIDDTLQNIDLESEVVVDVRMGEGSTDLKDVFKLEDGAVPKANDTSFGVGHAPFSETEKVVYETETQIYEDLRHEIPAVGEDVKVMGKREGETLDLTVAAATVSEYVEDADEYISVMEDVREFVASTAEKHTDRDLNVAVNTADDYDVRESEDSRAHEDSKSPRDEGTFYLTETGTSAEMGDDGSVGRGNRANGLITPSRNMSLEATSGKNPVNHIGKIYNLLSIRIARKVVDEVDGIEDLRVKLLSQIGKPIDEPQIAGLQVQTEEGVELSDVEYEIESITDDALENVTDLTRDIIHGEMSTF
ncbi:methionine adenosyltransferase [Halorutilales archaeon Cl-col2-1]